MDQWIIIFFLIAGSTLTGMALSWILGKILLRRKKGKDDDDEILGI